MKVSIARCLCIWFIVQLFFWVGCRPKRPGILKRTQYIMGTLVEITLIAEDDQATADAFRGAFQEMQRIERLMSRRIEGSALWRVNRSAGKKGVTVGPDLLFVIQVALETSDLSDGAFDITVGSLVNLWDRCRQENRLPSQREVRESLRLVDYRLLEIDERERTLFLRKEGMEIVLGGIAKGYAVDLAVRFLQDLGFRDLIVNAGGDLRTAGTKLGVPWVVGIQDPRDKSRILATITARDDSVATSGDYERYFIRDGVRYHEILDPSTGFPARRSRSVTVIHDELIWADALATAIFVMGPEKGIPLIEELAGVEALIIGSKGEVSISSGMKKRIEFQ